MLETAPHLVLRTILYADLKANHARLHSHRYFSSLPELSHQHTPHSDEKGEKGNYRVGEVIRGYNYALQCKTEECRP